MVNMRAALAKKPKKNYKFNDCLKYLRLRKMWRYGLGVLFLAGVTVAIPVDNGVEGDAEIECGPNSIIVNFNTQGRLQFNS